MAGCAGLKYGEDSEVAAEVVEWGGMNGLWERWGVEGSKWFWQGWGAVLHSRGGGGSSVIREEAVQEKAG